MSKIIIDEIEYQMESLPPDIKGGLESIGFIDAEIENLENQIKVLRTARIAYSSILKPHLASLRGINT
jgi:archaellum component FlaC